MKAVAVLFEVTIQFSWQDENEISTYHCGSLEGARKLVRDWKGKDKIRWYSIEGQEFLPCKEDDPSGQLYIGVIHHEFHEYHWKEVI